MTNLNFTKMSVSHIQLDLLKGFYLHCWCVFHKAAKQDFEFYAIQLDSAAISWHVQNVVAQIAEDYSSINFYLKTQLQLKNILITNE